MFFFFSSRRRHTRLQGDWSSDVCSSDLRGPWLETDLSGQRLTRPLLARIAQVIDVSGSSTPDRKSTRLNSSHLVISYAVFCLKKKKKTGSPIIIPQAYNIRYYSICRHRL